jgi:hypothetical protein
MGRGIIPFVVTALAILGLIGLLPTRSVALSDTPATPTVSVIRPCVDVTEEALDIRPPNSQVEFVFPSPVVQTPGGTPVGEDEAHRELYLVVLNLPPDNCAPFTADGNHKNGAVIWMVEQGKVEYAWEMVADAPPDSTPIIERGDSQGNEVNLNGNNPNGEIHGPGEPQILYPGDWVTQDRQVAVNLRNVGGDTAVILKAVFAVPEGGGCPGDCR